MNRHAVERLVIWQVATDPFRQDVDANAIASEVVCEASGIALHATDDRIEVGREDQDASCHPESTVRRSRPQ